MKKIPYIVVAILMMTSGTVLAQGSGPGGSGMKGHGRGDMRGQGGHRWWLNNNMQKELKLTDAQIQKISKISNDERRKAAKVHANLEISKIDLEEALDSKKVDEKKAREAIDKMVSVQSELAKGKMVTLLNIRKVLTYEQFQKLQEKRLMQKSDRRGDAGRNGKRKK